MHAYVHMHTHTLVFPKSSCFTLSSSSKPVCFAFISSFSCSNVSFMRSKESLSSCQGQKLIRSLQKVHTHACPRIHTCMPTCTHTHTHIHTHTYTYTHTHTHPLISALPQSVCIVYFIPVIRTSNNY